MENNIDTVVCEQCGDEFVASLQHGVFASDGSFYCNKCVNELIIERDEQYEN